MKLDKTKTLLSGLVSLLVVMHMPALAANWGDVADEGCASSYGGIRKFSSRLWNISGDWDSACRTQAGITIHGQYFARPHQCIDLGMGGEWGEWYVQDDSCKAKELAEMNLRWGAVARDECPGVSGLSDGRYRKYYTRLWNIPSGVDWKAACQHWPIEIGGVRFNGDDASVDDNVGFKLCIDKGVQGIWGEFYINDMTCKDQYATAPARGGELPSDQDVLYGFADLHAHPFANQGFGGQLFGSANGSLETAFANHPHDDANHRRYTWISRNISTMSLTDLLSLTLASENQIGWWDQGDGYPNFGQGPSAYNQDAWPRVWDSAHQQMHNVWVRRAANGGLRLMVALAANSDVVFGNADDTRLPSIAHQDIGEPRLSLDDWEALMRQTQDAHIFAQDNNWVDLALTPASAASSIKQGKLAMLWGTEVDHAFGCKLSDSDGPQAEHAKVCTWRDIDRAAMVHDMLGMRYIFPIHLKHNGLGGAGNNSPIAWNGDGDGKGMSPCQESQWFGGVSEENVGLGDSGMNVCGDFGLTPLGKHAIKTSWSLGHIVDVDHMSRRSHDQVYEMAKRYSVPIVRGHTGFIGTSVSDRRHEGNISSDQILDVLDTGGMVGAILFQGRLNKVANFHGASIPNTCGATSATWFNAFEYVKSLGAGVYSGEDGKRYGNLTFGTDFNGYAPLPIGRDQEYFFTDAADLRKCWYGENPPHITQKVGYPFSAPSQLKAAFGQTNNTMELTAGFDINKRGVATVGQLPDFFEDLRVQGASVEDLESVYRSALGFADMWRRLSTSAEQSVYWFAPALAEKYSSAQYPLRKVPLSSDFISTERHTLCRIKADNDEFYQLGVLSNNRCYGVLDFNSDDFDVLVIRPSGGSVRWDSTTTELARYETFMIINQRLVETDSDKVRGICQLKASHAGNQAEGIDGFVGQYRNGTCHSVGITGGGSVRYVDISVRDAIELLVINSGMMKKDLLTLQNGL